MERSRRDLSINTVTDNFIFKNNQITLLLPSYLTQGLVFTFLRLAKKWIEVMFCLKRVSSVRNTIKLKEEK